MARPQKIGLDYFPLDVGFFEDDKTQLVSAEFGIKAEALILRLLCKIYKEGYFYKWGDDQCLLMSKSMGVVSCSKKWISEVIDGLVRRCFFDEGCYKQFNILTSSAIQRRYLEATKERKNIGLDRPYWLLSSQKTPPTVDNPQETLVNLRETLVNPPINPQSKGEEIKGEEMKKKYTLSSEKNLSARDDFEILEGKEKYDELMTWINSNAPRVNKMAEPFTQSQVITLLSEYKRPFIEKLLRTMHSDESLSGRRVADFTFRDWAERRGVMPSPQVSDARVALWRECKELIKQQLSHEDFAWFEHCVFLDCQETILRLQVPNEAYMPKIQSYLPSVSLIIQQVLGEVTKVRFIISKAAKK